MAVKKAEVNDSNHLFDMIILEDFFAYVVMNF